MLHIGANVCEVTGRIAKGVYHADKHELVEDIVHDTYLASELIWDNRGMIKNMPAALVNTAGHINGSREIDYSITPGNQAVMMLPGA